MNYTELRGKTSDEIFEAVAKDTGVPTQLLKNMWQVESGGGQNMKSPAGAVGHMQIMPRELGVMRKTYGEDLDPMNLADSVFMAGKMLKENMQHFGNIPDAVSAYNGGWTKSRWSNPETSAYTPKVLAGTGITFDAQGTPHVEQPYTTSRAQIDSVRPEPVVQAKTYLNSVEKNAIEQQMYNRQLQGTEANEVVNEAVQLSFNPEAAFGLANSLSTTPPATSYDKADQAIALDIKASVKEANRIENTTTGDAFSAAFKQYSLTGTAMEAMANTTADIMDKRQQVDRKWIEEYEAKREQMIKGLSPYAVTQLDQALNAQEARDIVDRDKRDQVVQQTLNDSGHPILWGLTAGILDPAGWVVGGGVGKAFMLGKSVSMAARMGKLAAGNAVGNAVVMGAMDELGAQITPDDYIHAAAFGLATGAALGAFSRGDRAAMQKAAADMHEAAVERTQTFVERAAKERYKMYAGENPFEATDPNALVQLHRGSTDSSNGQTWWTTNRAKAAEYGDVDSIWVRASDIKTKGVAGHNGPDEVVFQTDPHSFAVGGPSADDLAQTAAKMSEREVMDVVDQVLTQPTAESKVFQPRDIDPVETGRLQQQYSLDSVSDEHRLSSINSLYKSAEAFLSSAKDKIRHTVIAAQKHRKISDILGFRSAGNELLSDDNPLAKTLGMVVAEDAAGVSGVRGVTVAIKSRLLNNHVNLNIERGIHENYITWLKDKGVGRVKGALETYTTGKHITEFYAQVAAEMRNRANPMFVSTAHGSVQRAANVLEDGFQRMGDLQRKANTLGNEFIPTSSRGYLPQQLNGKAFAALSGAEKRQVQQEFIRQATRDFGWDTEFASKKVAEYMNRAEDAATPAGRMNPSAGKDLMGVLMEELDNPNLAPDQYMQILERLRSGAAKHTNKRLDWDLNATIRMDNGDMIPLSSLYNNDILSLYKGYANRVSGDVAFAHVGIYGDRDIRMITEALQRSKVGDPTKTIPAWQQVVNEVYQRPTATDAGGNLSTTARFIRQYTGIRLLGGVGFAQMAELSNTIAHLGVGTFMKFLPSVPRLLKETKMLKAGKIPENSVMWSVDSIAGSPLGVEQFQMVMPQVIDEGLSIVDQRSFNTVMRAMGGAQLLHNKFSFMRAVTAVEQRFVGNEIVMKAMRYMRDGTDDVALREMGITPELAAKFRAEMGNIAEFTESGHLKALNLYHMKDMDAVAEFITAVRRGTGQIIQDNFPGETGKWMRSEIGQLLMQFRKFPSVAIEKQYMRQYGKFGFTKALGGTLAAMGIGTLLYYGRAMVAASLLGESEREKFLEARLAPASVAGGALMYVSNLGMLNDFMQLGSGVGNMLDDSMDLGWTHGRGIPAQGIGGVIPSLGTLSDAYNLTQQPSVNGALKILPFTNLPMVLPVINAIKHSDDD